MPTNLVTVTFHGILGDSLSKSIWKVAVKSVGEALYAIETISGKQLYKKILELSNKNVKYAVAINGEPFKTDQDLSLENPESIRYSELCMKKNLETIDVIPVIEGAGDSFLNIFTVILGAALIATGLGAFAGLGLVLGPTWGTVAVFAGLGLLAAGVTNLLTSPPKFEDFREIGGGGSRSYLFNGPQNTTREGGPVPVVYGEIIAGSQVISTTYDIINISASQDANSAIPTENTGTEPDHARIYFTNKGTLPN